MSYLYCGNTNLNIWVNIIGAQFVRVGFTVGLMT